MFLLATCGHVSQPDTCNTAGHRGTRPAAGGEPSEPSCHPEQATRAPCSPQAAGLSARSTRPAPHAAGIPTSCLLKRLLQNACPSAEINMFPLAGKICAGRSSESLGRLQVLPRCCPPRQDTHTLTSGPHASVPGHFDLRATASPRCLNCASRGNSALQTPWHTTALDSGAAILDHEVFRKHRT